MDKIKVAVLDEHDIFRRGMLACLEDDPSIEVVGEGHQGSIPPDADVVVTSPSLLTSIRPQCRVVVCGDASHTEPPGTEVMACLPRGELSPDQLLGAIHAAAAGLRVDHTPAERTSALLDDRQRAVLELLADGAATAEIAEALGYSVRTIKSVIRDIEVHLGAKSRSQAVAVGIREGLI